jgi:uncharacterized protein
MLAVITAGIFFAAGIARAEDPTKLPQPTTYVSDFAGVIDADSKQQIEALCTEIYEKAHATIEVVTIQSLDGDSIEDFTTKLEDKWKVGPKGTDKGIVMVFAIKDHKRRIEVGYGLEGILNDAKVGDIGRSMVPQLQAGQYGPGILSGVQQIGNVIAADANVTLTDAPQTDAPQRVVTRSHGFPWIRLILFIFFLLIFARGGRGGRGGWLWFLLGSMMGGGGGRGDGGTGFGGGSGGGSDFGGGFGGGSGGGGASGDW